MDAADPLSPIDGLLSVLDDGQATGTNKYMLLLALIDLAPGVNRGDRTLRVAEIAEKVLELAWDQIRPWDASTPALSQVTSSNREATYISQALLLAQLVGFQRWHQVRPLLEPTDEWSTALAKTTHDLNRNPVARLQTLQGVPRTFLYRHDFANRAIQFAVGALEDLVRFGPVLRPLVEHRHTQLVIQANRSVLPAPIDERVFEHLFGEQRHMPPTSLDAALLDLQGGVCLWSGQRIDRDGVSAQTDHILPWARVRLSAAENFAITTASANRSKTNLLLGERLVDTWATHLATHRTAIEEAAQAASWETDLQRVVGIAVGLYRRLPNGSPLWDGPNPPTSLDDGSRARIVNLIESAVI